MARSINAGGVGYANLVSLIGVEDDNATVKDFFNGSNTITVQSAGNQPINNSTYGYGLKIAVLDSFHVYGYTMAAHPAIVESSTGATMFVAFNKITDANSGFCGVMAEAADAALIQVAIGSTTTPLEANINGTQITSSGGNVGLNTACSIAASISAAGAGALYVNGSSVGTTTGAPSPGSKTPVRIGTLDGQGAFGAEICYIVWFNTVLSSGNISSLHSSLTGSNAFSLITAAAPPTPTLMGQLIF